MQLAYARAFAVTPLTGLRKYLRGAAWLLVLLAVTGGGLTLRYLIVGRPPWVLLIAIPAYLLLQFGFFIGDSPPAARPALRVAGSGTRRSGQHRRCDPDQRCVLVRATPLVSAYGHAYGGFGIALSMVAFLGILALFWVWVAAVMGVYWERKAGSSAVSAMHELSADIARS